jgi:hypothetical protein
MGQSADHMTVRHYFQVENQSEEKLGEGSQANLEVAQELYRSRGSRQGEKNEFRKR